MIRYPMIVARVSTKGKVVKCEISYDINTSLT